ncbi:unnamed protein product [Caenorhabditis brenneri]
MTETPELSFYKKTCAKSERTAAILVINGKKLHVNVALLCYHSDYFNKLFFSFYLKRGKEYEVYGVDFEDFATVLSLVLNVPIKINEFRVESLLKIADRFQLPAAKYHLELILMTTKRDRESLLKLADEYKLDMVMDRVLSGFKCKSEFTSITNEPLEFIENLSAEGKDKVFKRALEIDENTNKPTTSTLFIDVYAKAFAKSDKTDAVLVVDGKKLHVNKALLSYHSDYFNTLFNSKSEEKSMKEYPIEDVKFKNFATLLSLVQIQPIALTKNNAENILELSDRFQLRVVRRHIELFLLSSGMHNLEQIRIAEKYEMNDLLEFGIQNLTKANFNDLPEKPVYKGFSSETRSKLFYRYLRI